MIEFTLFLAELDCELSTAIFLFYFYKVRKLGQGHLKGGRELARNI